MAAVVTLSTEDQAFLDKCEEELKHRYTEQDEEFMKVFNAEPSTPPILDHWYVSQGRRNDRRNNRSFQPYDRRDRDRNFDRRDNRRDNYDRGDRRGYDNRRYDDRNQGHRNQYSRY